jgi:hypothetical protein
VEEWLTVLRADDGALRGEGDEDLRVMKKAAPKRATTAETMRQTAMSLRTRERVRLGE